MLKFIAKHPYSVMLAVILHIGLITLFSIKWLDKPEVVKISSEGNSNQEIKQIAQLEPMKTFTVDSAQVQAKINKIKAEQEARRQEQKNLQAKTQQERERLKELKKKQETEKQKANLAKKQADEQKRKADQERKKTEEAKRLAQIEKKKADAERKKAEQAKKATLAAEKKTKEAQQKATQAEKQRQAEEKKKQALQKEVARKAKEKKALEKEALAAQKEKEKQQAAAELQRQLDEEAQQQREAQKRKQMLSLRETYISSITAKVKDSWRTPARISSEAQCDLKITQSPTGNITSVKVLNCNKFANKQFQEAAEKAVYRAEPLPAPPVKELFEREITFQFKP